MTGEDCCHNAAWFFENDFTWWTKLVEASWLAVYHRNRTHSQKPSLAGNVPTFHPTGRGLKAYQVVWEHLETSVYSDDR